MVQMHWTAAEAKHRFSELLDASNIEPQMILRHGKPAGVLVNWKLFEANSQVFLPGMETYLDELADINTREGEFDPLPRSDRKDIEAVFS